MRGAGQLSTPSAGLSGYLAAGLPNVTDLTPAPVTLRLRLPVLATLIGTLTLAVGAQRRPVAPAAPPIPASERPRLVVLITVDQLRPDYLTRWDRQFTGAFRRLLDESAFYTHAVHDHAITETAPGHASTLSGRFPYSTGIAENSAGVNTSDAPLVGSRGAGASPYRFLGTTLADWMTAADPQTRVLSVSRKDRGAILPIGRGIYPVFWYTPDSGRFVTSSWYADSLPTWVQEFNAEQRVTTRYAGRTWDLLLPETEYPEADSVEAESAGQGFTFPHQLARDETAAQNGIIGQPWMDELTLDLAWRGVRTLDLGAGPQTDLLAVSLSTTDAVGHRWGPDSRELHDQILRLDRVLGTFLDSLIALRGRENIVIALTSDHGVAPVPEVRSTWGDNSRATRVLRADFDPVFHRISQKVILSRIPADAFTFDFPTLSVDRSKVGSRTRELRTVARSFAAEARKVPGVLRADVVDDLILADTVKDVIARRWAHMFRPGGDALVVITLRPFNYSGTGVASHGSPHDYDARVPLIFWGRHFRHFADSSTARVVDLAPTLAHLLGVTPLERLDGHVLVRTFVLQPD